VRTCSGLDRYLTQTAGFVKLQQLPIDSLWVSRHALEHVPTDRPLWSNPGLDSLWSYVGKAMASRGETGKLWKQG
jgi:hypothetical protein